MNQITHTFIDPPNSEYLIPKKIRWIFPAPTLDYISTIPSRGLRSFIRKIPDLFEHEAISVSWSDTIDQAEFKAWLPFYQSKMKELNHEVIATAEWLQEKLKQKKQISALYLHKSGKMVGSGIISSSKTAVTLAFKASERLKISNDSNANIGSAIDFLFLQKYHSDTRLVNSGTSRNAFGVINSVGMADYKLRFGYIPTSHSLEFHTQLPINQEGWVMSFAAPAQQPDQMKLFAFFPKNKQALAESIIEKFPVYNGFKPQVIYY